MMNIKSFHLLTVTSLLFLTGCASSQEVKEDKKPTLSSKEVTQLFEQSDKDIQQHHYDKAKENYNKIIKEATKKEDKDKAKQLNSQLSSYIDSYQMTLTANDEESYKQAGQALLAVIKKDENSVIAKETLNTLVQFEQSSGLKPDQLSMDIQRYVLFDKHDKTKVYPKATLSGKTTDVKKNTLAIAEDYYYYNGEKCYRLYYPASDKEKQKQIGYVKEKDITLLSTKELNQPGKVIKSGESKVSINNSKKKINIKKGYYYYIPAEITYNNTHYYVLNKINDDKKPSKNNGKYIYRGIVKTDMIQLDK